MDELKPTKKNTVLVVDDVSVVRSILSALLTQNGFEVVGEAASGIEAMELFAKLSPDLVTMDVVMPKMSGIEAIRKMTKSWPHSKVIVVSAMGQESLVMEAIHAGAKGYILKPFSSEEVVSTLRRVLQDTTEYATSERAVVGA